MFQRQSVNGGVVVRGPGGWVWVSLEMAALGLSEYLQWCPRDTSEEDDTHNPSISYEE